MTHTPPTTMRDVTTPPEPGLTRENTGYPSAIYAGWFRTLASIRQMERRALRRSYQAPMDADEMRGKIQEQRRQVKNPRRGRKIA
jgi:hypothetical protein